MFVRFSESLRPDRLTAEMPPGVPAAHALAETWFATDAELVASIIHAFQEPSFVYLLFDDGSRSIRVHVEGRASKGDIGDLVRMSKRIAERLDRCARDLGTRTDRVTISLYAENDFISAGVRRSFGERLGRRFSDSIFGDVVIGFLTFVLSGILTGQWSDAVVVGLASVLCLVAWLALQVKGESDEYEWRGF